MFPGIGMPRAQVDLDITSRLLGMDCEEETGFGGETGSDQIIEGRPSDEPVVAQPARKAIEPSMNARRVAEKTGTAPCSNTSSGTCSKCSWLLTAFSRIAAKGCPDSHYRPPAGSSFSIPGLTLDGTGKGKEDTFPIPRSTPRNAAANRL